MLRELKEKIVGLLTSDPTLAPLLASNTAVYYRRPPKQAEFPCLTFSADEQPDPECDRHGKFMVELRLDIWSVSADVNDSVVAALDALLFDAHRRAQLDTAHFRVGGCRRVSQRAVEGSMTEMSGQEIEKRETVWRMSLLKKGV